MEEALALLKSLVLGFLSTELSATLLRNGRKPKEAGASMPHRERRTLVVSPEIPYPVFKGNQSRIDLSIRTLIAQGSQVHLIVLNRNQPRRRSVDVERELTRAYPALAGVTVRRHPKLNRSSPRSWFNSILHRIEKSTPRYNPVSDYMTAPFHFRRTLRRVVHDFDPDLIFVNYVHLANALPRCCRAVKIIDTHDVNAHIQKEHHRINPSASPIDLERFARSEIELADRFDVIVAINKTDAEYFRTHCTAVVRTVNASIHPGSLERGVHIYDLLFVGSISPFNIDAILQFDATTLPRLRKVFPNIKIALAGEVCKASALKKLRSKNYIFLGRVDNLADAYSTSKIVICPVRAGAGTKIKVVEALAHGKATVMTPAAGAGIEVTSGANAIIAELGAPFADALVRLLRDPVARRRVEANARLLFEERHSHPVVMQELADVTASIGAHAGGRASYTTPMFQEARTTLRGGTGLVFAMDARRLMTQNLHLGRLLRSQGCNIKFLKVEQNHLNFFSRHNFDVHAVKGLIRSHHKRFADQILTKFRISNDIPDQLIVRGVDMAEDMRIHRMMFPHQFAGNKTKKSIRWALVLFATLDECCDRLNPDFLVGWNGNGSHMIYLMKLVGRARRVPVFHVERGFFPNTYVFDPRGVNFKGLLAGAHVSVANEEEIEQAREFRRTYRANGRSVVGNCNQPSSGGQVRRNLGLGAGEPFVLVPEQIEGDSNLVLNSPRYQKMADVLHDLLPAAADIGLKVVFRPHPENTTRNGWPAEFAARGMVVDTRNNIHDVIRESFCVVTINSTTGLEALMYEKPTLVLGNAVYSGKGFTYDVRGGEEIYAALRSIKAQSSGDQVKERRFLGFLRDLTHRYLLHLDRPPDDPVNLETLARALAYHGITLDQGVRDFWPTPHDEDVTAFLHQQPQGGRLVVLDGLGQTTRRYNTGPDQPLVVLDNLFTEYAEALAPFEVAVLTGQAGKALSFEQCIECVVKFLASGTVERIGEAAALLAVCPAAAPEVERARERIGVKLNRRACLIDEYFISHLI